MLKNYREGWLNSRKRTQNSNFSLDIYLKKMKRKREIAIAEEDENSQKDDYRDEEIVFNVIYILFGIFIFVTVCMVLYRTFVNPI